MDALTDNIGRVRSRIVQSPDRIKRNIITMGSTASEDKKTVAMNETKIRDLQAKINALLNIEKVRVYMCERSMSGLTNDMLSAYRTFGLVLKVCEVSRKRFVHWKNTRKSFPTSRTN